MNSFSGLKLIFSFLSCPSSCNCYFIFIFVFISFQPSKAVRVVKMGPSVTKEVAHWQEILVVQWIVEGQDFAQIIDETSFVDQILVKIID